MLVSMICLCTLGVLLFGLGLWISLLRYSRSQFYAGQGDPRSFLTKLGRAHGNTAEFAPFLALLIVLAGMAPESDPAIAAMIAATLSRVLVVVGFLTSRTLERMSPIKAAGAIGTYLAGLVLTFDVVVAYA